MRTVTKVHSIDTILTQCMFILSDISQSVPTATIEPTKSRRRQKQPKSDADLDRDTQVITLTDLNAKSVLSTRNVDIFVEFYAPWCVHCQQLKPELRSTANAFKNVKFSELSRILGLLLFCLALLF